MCDGPEGAGRRTLAAEGQVLLGSEDGDLERAMSQLSPEMRAVMQATVLDGLSTRETALLLGIPANTVKSRLHNAIQKLKSEFERSGYA